jgi:hypothetical protein
VLVIEFTQLGTLAHVSLCVPNLVRIPRPTSAGMGRWMGRVSTLICLHIYLSGSGRPVPMGGSERSECADCSAYAHCPDVFTSTIDPTVEDSESMTSFGKYCSITGKKSTLFGCA